MASRSQIRPPRSPLRIKSFDDLPLEKRRKTGAGKMVGLTSRGRVRQPLAVINKENLVPTDDAANIETSECATVEFTKEEVEALLNEKIKGKKFDFKGKMEQMNEYIKKLKLCVKWFQELEENHLLKQEKLQKSLESAETKCNDAELRMKIKEEGFNATIEELKKENSFLKEKLAKEETDKLDATECYKKEKEARVAAENLKVSLSTDLEKAQKEIESATKMVNRLKEYNESLQVYNSTYMKELKTAKDSLSQIAAEKQAISENLSTLRDCHTSLQDQLRFYRASQDEALNKKEALMNENSRLRVELQHVRETHNQRVQEVRNLTADLQKIKESTGKSLEELSTLTKKSYALEESCYSQTEQVRVLRDQLDDATEKLKMANLSISVTRTKFEEQERFVHELKDRLADAELQISSGEKLRKQLHNTILELKGNIRVFCRVRPMLPDDGAGMETTVISYPVSTEALGRGIDLMQSGQKYPFTFDKVFTHEASQQDVFVEISQLVQSALDGYKVCIFAYGQTGSGKTYTMMGRPDALEQKGLIPRSLEQIFQTSQSLSALGWKYKMQASVLEIYNETIRDLLSINRSSGSDMIHAENGVARKQYTIKHDANGNTHVSDLTIIDVDSINEISSLLQQAAQSRSVGKSQMNEQSSRSHFVFTLRISGVNESTEQQVQGVLNLIDLAGSERLSKSGSTGDRLKETRAINKSLSSLSDVILSLAKKEDHVPFRNSKLTYLLQPCLGGDSKTLMFVNLSPDPYSVGESLCSLRFAARVNVCEIGVPRRQMNTRAPNSRLSYG